MGREVRRVPKDWQHPKDELGRFIPQCPGSWYQDDADEFMAIATSKGLQAAIEEEGNPPDRNNYMPVWTETEATHYMMYENTSEGTPISPAFRTPEELARWLADTRASAFAGMTATYDQWLRVCYGGYAPSAVIVGNELRSGVEGL